MVALRWESERTLAGSCPSLLYIVGPYTKADRGGTESECNGDDNARNFPIIIAKLQLVGIHHVRALQKVRCLSKEEEKLSESHEGKRKVNTQEHVDSAGESHRRGGTDCKENRGR